MDNQVQVLFRFPEGSGQSDIKMGGDDVAAVLMAHVLSGEVPTNLLSMLLEKYARQLVVAHQEDVQRLLLSFFEKRVQRQKEQNHPDWREEYAKWGLTDSQINALVKAQISPNRIPTLAVGDLVAAGINRFAADAIIQLWEQYIAAGGEVKTPIMQLGIGIRTYERLIAAEVFYIEEVLGMTEEDLRQRGIGQRGINNIRKHLLAHGLLQESKLAPLPPPAVRSTGEPPEDDNEEDGMTPV